MKRSSPDSPSCTSSSSSSVPDQQLPRKNRLQVKKAAARSSIYRGVTRHRWTGRFEAHLWDRTCRNNIGNKKGRQVYLGAYDSEEAAAHTYDLAALKHWGPETTLNFPIETYESEVEEMKRVSKEEFLASLRRRSNGFSRGVSKYRGVARHHQNGRWEARIGQVLGHKYLYLGIYDTQEEAAAAYDRAAIEHRGPNAFTNFDISNYKGNAPQDPTFQTETLPCIVDMDNADQQSDHDPRLTSPVWTSCVDDPLDHSVHLPDPFQDSGFEVNIELIFNTTDCNWAL